MSVVVVATITPVPEHTDEVIAALREAVGKVHTEPGCELYALHRGEDRLVMIERWTSAEDLDRHGTSEALVELNTALEGKLVTGTDVQRLEALPAGDPVKGSV